MIDRSAFHALSYGLYVVAAEADGRKAGCVVNTFQQVTSAPPQVSVALNKENATTAAVRAAGRYTAVCLAQDAGMELIGTFGFHCSTDVDKFAACEVAVDAAGMPYVAEQCVSRFSVRVVQEVDLGTHVLFIGEVEEAERICAAEPMTYAYYHQVKGGKSAPKASSYQGEEAPAPAPADAAPAGSGAAPAGKPRYAWRCTVCGHIEYADELPDDYLCPVCGVGKELFERIEV